MSLNSAALEFLAAKGLSLDDAAKLASLLEIREQQETSSAAARQARYRARKRNACDVTRDVTRDVTPPPKENIKPPVPISDEIGIGGEKPDLSKSLFDQGVVILTAKGKTEAQARAVLAKFQRDFGNGPVLDALDRCRNATEPISAMRDHLGKAKAQREYLGP